MLENEMFLECTAVGANVGDPIVSRPQIHGHPATVDKKNSIHMSNFTCQAGWPNLRYA